MKTPTEHDHRAAIAANLDRIKLPTYADAVRALPVIPTCGDCSHFEVDSQREKGGGDCALDVGATHEGDAPPSWCPLRGGER